MLGQSFTDVINIHPSDEVLHWSLLSHIEELLTKYGHWQESILQSYNFLILRQQRNCCVSIYNL